MRFNKIAIGMILGILFPLATFFVVYLIKFNEYPFKTFVRMLNNYGVFVQLISLCAIPNLLGFFAFIRTNKLLSARGVLLATFIFTLVVLIIKVVL